MARPGEHGNDDRADEVCHLNALRRGAVLAGLLVPLVFWGTLALCGAMLGDYSHLSNLVSELGATGTETRVVFAAGLLVCSLLSLVFSHILARRRPRDPDRGVGRADADVVVR